MNETRRKIDIYGAGCALADCCAGRGVDLDVLRTAGLGRPIAGSAGGA